MHGISLSVSYTYIKVIADKMAILLTSTKLNTQLKWELDSSLYISDEKLHNFTSIKFRDFKDRTDSLYLSYLCY